MQSEICLSMLICRHTKHSVSNFREPRLRCLKYFQVFTDFIVGNMKSSTTETLLVRPDTVQDNQLGLIWYMKTHFNRNSHLLLY